MDRRIRISPLCPLDLPLSCFVRPSLRSDLHNRRFFSQLVGRQKLFTSSVQYPLDDVPVRSRSLTYLPLSLVPL